MSWLHQTKIVEVDDASHSMSSSMLLLSSRISAHMAGWRLGLAERPILDNVDIERRGRLFDPDSENNLRKLQKFEREKKFGFCVKKNV